MRVKRFFGFIHRPKRWVDSTVMVYLASLAVVRTNVGIELDFPKTFWVQSKEFKIHYKQGTFYCTLRVCAGNVILLCS